MQRECFVEGTPDFARMGDTHAAAFPCHIDAPHHPGYKSGMAQGADQSARRAFKSRIRKELLTAFEILFGAEQVAAIVVHFKLQPVRESHVCRALLALRQLKSLIRQFGRSEVVTPAYGAV